MTVTEFAKKLKMVFDLVEYRGEEPISMSPVTIAELTFGFEMALSEKIRQKRYAALDRLKRKPHSLLTRKPSGGPANMISSGAAYPSRSPSP